MKFCIHCGKRVTETLHPYHNGGPIHRACYIKVHKDSEFAFKVQPALVQERGALRLRLVSGRSVK